MADPFFYFGQEDDEDYLMSLGLILPPPAPAPPGSAFEAYHQRRRAPALSLESPMAGGRGHQHGSNSGAAEGANVNVHRRMFGYLGRIDAAAAGAAAHPPAPGNGEAAAAAAPRSSRFRHIMRERLRRERLSQGFADLHALLPPGALSKGGKNDIVGAAAVYIRELERRKRLLSARNQELLVLDRAAATRWMGGGARNNAGGGGDGMVVKVRAEIGDHAAAVDVFEAVLRRLKAMEEQLRVTAIRSCFRAGGTWVDVGVESHKQVSTREVDTAVTNALMELSGNELGKQDPRSSKPSFSCQVESGVPMG